MSRGIISLDKFEYRRYCHGDRIIQQDFYCEPRLGHHVNPDWGIKNLEKAIDNGSPTVKRLSTPEAKAKFKEATTMTPEKAARLKARYGK